MWAWILFKELINHKAPFGQEFMIITMLTKWMERRMQNGGTTTDSNKKQKTKVNSHVAEPT
jgi:hypothetical protein